MFKFNKNNKIHTNLFIMLFFVVFFIFTPKAQAVVKELEGYAWSDGIGWISFNCRNHENVSKTSPCQVPYSVTWDDNTQTNPTGEFKGYAWNDMLGWLKFENNSAPFPPNSPNTWNTIATSSRMLNGLTSGWARFCTPFGYVGSSKNFKANSCTGSITSTIINGLKLGGWDGWVSLYGNTYGSIVKNGPNVVTGSYLGSHNAGTGKFSGWWWGGSEFVGWINIDGVSTEGTNPKIELGLVSNVSGTNGPICVNCLSNPQWVTNTDPNPNANNFVYPAELTVPSSESDQQGIKILTSRVTAVWKTKDMKSCVVNVKHTTPYSTYGDPAFNGSTHFTQILQDGSSVPVSAENNSVTDKARETVTVSCIGNDNKSYVKTATYDILPKGSHVYLSANPAVFTNPYGVNTTILKYSSVNTVPNTCYAKTIFPANTTTAWDGPTYQAITAPAFPNQASSGGIIVPLSTTVKKVTFKLDCLSSITGLLVSDTADVYLGEQSSLAISSNKSNVCPGETVDITWNDLSQSQGTLKNCHAYANPAPYSGGVINWNTNQPNASINGFDTNLSPLNATGTQSGVEVPANTNYSLVCTNTLTGVLIKADTTVLLNPPALCNQAIPVIDLNITKLNNSNISPAKILQVDKNDTIQLDWDSSGYDWSAIPGATCTATVGSTVGPHNWTTLPQKALPQLNPNNYKGEDNISVPMPGATKKYWITCQNPSGTIKAQDYVTVTTNPNSSANTLNLYIKAKSSDPYSQGTIYVTPNYNQGPYLAWTATTPITVNQGMCHAIGGPSSNNLWITSLLPVTNGYIINSTYKPPSGYYAPPEQANNSTTDYTLECTDINGDLYTSNTVSVITSANPPPIFDVTNPVCVPGSLDVDTQNPTVDVTWSPINPSPTGTNPETCSIDTNPAGYNEWSGGLYSVPATIHAPNNYKLTCYDKAGSEAHVSFNVSVDLAGNCGVIIGSHGVKIPTWLQH